MNRRVTDLKQTLPGICILKEGESPIYIIPTNTVETQLSLGVIAQSYLIINETDIRGKNPEAFSQLHNAEIVTPEIIKKLEVLVE